MTENQYPPSQPEEPGKGDGQRVPSPPKRRRHASDGIMPRRGVSVAPRSGVPGDVPNGKSPVAEPAAPPPVAPLPPVSPKPPTPHVAASSRFEGRGDRKPVQPKQPKQSEDFVRTAPQPIRPVRLPIDAPFERFRLLFLAVVMVPLCIWASYPSWGSMVYEWYHTDDYSHGFIVIPATILFLCLRWDTYPGTRYKLDWVGLFPFILYGVLRIVAGIRYLDPLDMVAIWFWILGVVWFFYGGRVFLWALPSLCFLLFMFQLPWRIDVLMKNHLQFFAAHFAAVLLQLMGEAAVPIKNTIRLSSTELGVEAACSGLRFLMSVFAIAFAAVLLLRRSWWQNILILAIAAPLALFVNASRIAITGILLEHHYERVSQWAAKGQSVGVVADAFAGKVAIALALGLFALFIWYLGKVFRRVEI